MKHLKNVTALLILAAMLLVVWRPVVATVPAKNTRPPDPIRAEEPFAAPGIRDRLGCSETDRTLNRLVGRHRGATWLPSEGPLP